MIQHIDFLPAGYRNKRSKRRTMRWRQLVLVAFLAIVVAGGLRQRRVRIGLEANRDNLKSQAVRISGQLENADALRHEIQRLDRRADLLTFLRLRTPPTRVLAAVANCLPKFVSLTEYGTRYETSQQQNKPIRKTIDPAAAASIPAVEQDLERLQREWNNRSLIVTVKGIARDDILISQFVARLQRNEAFDDVRWLYTDQKPYAGHTMRGFEIRLRVRRRRRSQGRRI